MLATEPQKQALHKFGVRELDPELSKEEASKLLDALVGLSKNGNRQKLSSLIDELNTPGILSSQLEQIEKAQPDARVRKVDEVNVEQAAEDYVVRALLEARHAFMVVFPELSTEAIAPLALSLCQSILKDVRSEKLNGGAKHS